MSSSTLFERVLSSFLGNVLLDRDALQVLRDSIDWDDACDRFADPALAYPHYYCSQNFHGVPGGYLSVDAAVTYDPITQYVLPPGERWVRQGLVSRIQNHPRRILDLGCGTGSTTLMLARAFPKAEVIGLDLSPHMLVMAEHKATQLPKTNIRWRHGLAESTLFPDASFDLVTASLLFHETPVPIARQILQECHRLLNTGGEVLILDGSQETLPQVPWLMEIFEELYLQDYARGNLGQWMTEAGFGAVQTESLWAINQVTRGVKGVASSEQNSLSTADSPTEEFGDLQTAIA